MGGKHSRRGRAPPADYPYYSTDWPIVADYSMRKWRKNKAQLLGFNPNVNYTYNKGLRLQPTATCGRLLLANITTLFEAMERFGFYNEEEDDQPVSLPPFMEPFRDRKRLLTIEDVGRPPKVVDTPDSLKLSGLLHDTAEDVGYQRLVSKVNVIASRDVYVVLQIIRATGANKIVLVREGKLTYSVLSVFTVETEDDNPYLMEAVISPDFSKIIVKASWGFARKYRFIPEKNDVCLYNTDTKGSLVPTPKVIFSEDGINRVVAFDPRYGWTRLVSGFRQALQGNDMITVYDLQRDEIVTSSAPGKIQSTQSLIYSPDGRFIASLTASVLRKCTFDVLAVLIYDSDTLDILKDVSSSPCIETTNPMLHSLFPLFSMNGRYVAVFSGETEDPSEERSAPTYIVTLAVPVEVRLQNLCRLTLRRYLTPAGVAQLPIPEKLKDYLLFRPYR